jgi:hypothetical protein
MKDHEVIRVSDDLWGIETSMFIWLFFFDERFHAVQCYIG